MAKLTQKQRREWQGQTRASEAFFKTYISPSRRFEQAFRSNAAHWSRMFSSAGMGKTGVGDWPYDRITANLIYANHNTIVPQVALRHPKVLVRPSARATPKWERMGEGDSFARYVAAAMIQIVTNWRVREFDFKRQWRRCVSDDYLRGVSVIRHGFIAEDQGVRTNQGNRTINMEPHQHIRPGWPFAVHQPVDLFRWDVAARDPDARDWSAYGKFWRIEDLRADSRFQVPKNLEPTHVAGAVDAVDPNSNAFYQAHKDALGRMLVWEIWDKRTQRVIYWLDTIDQEIGVEDWPLEFEGLPDTLFISNETSEGIMGISEVDVLWEVNQEINKLVSLLLIYAKRSVPVIGADRSKLEDDEMDKITDAEILEVIQTTGSPDTAIKLLGLQANLQPIVFAINQMMQIHREVSGQSRMSHGARENVESATEAAAITAGASVRISDRLEKFREFAARVVRKDFQIIQQARPEDMLVDVINTEKLPEVWKVTTEQIKMEYDFEIMVGSTEADDENIRKRDALAFTQAVQSHPDIVKYFSPRFLARNLTHAYGYDEDEAMAPQEGVEQQTIINALASQLESGGQASSGGNGLAAALDATKQTNPSRGPVQ